MAFVELAILAFVKAKLEPDSELEIQISTLEERIYRSHWADMYIGELEKKALIMALEMECHNVVKYYNIYF